MPVVAATAGSPVADQARLKPYRVAELAEEWDLDASTVYRMIYNGRLRAERHGPRGGALRVPVDAVAEYLRQVTTRMPVVDGGMGGQVPVPARAAAAGVA